MSDKPTGHLSPMLPEDTKAYDVNFYVRKQRRARMHVLCMLFHEHGLSQFANLVQSDLAHGTQQQIDAFYEVIQEWEKL